MKFAVFEQIKKSLESVKRYALGEIGNVANATVEAVEEIAGELNNKFDKTGGTIDGNVAINGNVAEGHLCYADGETSHAEGRLCYAGGDNGCHASGFASIACSTYNALLASKISDNIVYISLPSENDFYGKIYNYANMEINILQKFAPGQKILIMDWSNSPRIKDIIATQIISVDVENGTLTIDYNYAEAQSECIIVNLDMEKISYNYTCYAEGKRCISSGNATHSEGEKSKAIGSRSHAEGYNTQANGDNSHAEGYNTQANGGNSHAEGYQTIAAGGYSHVEGHNCYVDGQYGDHASGSACIAVSNGTVLFISSATGTTITVETRNKYRWLYDIDSIFEKFDVNQEILLLNEYYATGSFVKRKIVSIDRTNYKIMIDSKVPTSNFRCNLIINPSAKNTAKYYPNYAEGTKCVSIGYNSSHAEGYRTKAFYGTAHAEGYESMASSNGSHAEGYQTIALGTGSHAGGYQTIASGEYQTAIGKYNKESSAETDKLIIGNGTSDTTRSNCFRVTNSSGVYSNSTYHSSGADYAEMFEWLDSNSNNEDRAGLFVTLEGNNIKIASPKEDYILGVVSACPSVCGDVCDEIWNRMFETDAFGRTILEEIEIPEKTEDIFVHTENGEKQFVKTNVIQKAHKELVPKLNPDYDNTQQYIPRSKRPEWAAIGLLGKLVVIDDGSCVINGYCKVGEGGIAVMSEQKTRFRVMARLDDNHIKILML